MSVQSLPAYVSKAYEYTQGCQGQGKISGTEFVYRPGKSQGILLMAREFRKDFEREKSGNLKMAGSLQKIDLFCSRGERMYFLMR